MKTSVLMLDAFRVEESSYFRKITFDNILSNTLDEVSDNMVMLLAFFGHRVNDLVPFCSEEFLSKSGLSLIPEKYQEMKEKRKTVV